MKKILILILFFGFVFSVNAQYVNFKLQEDGSFLSEDNKPFSVLNFQGRESGELYDVLKKEVFKQFSNTQERIIALKNGADVVNGIIPKDDVQAIDDGLITINSFSDLYQIRRLIVLNVGFLYNVKIEIKDEKIRVSVKGLKYYEYNGNHIPSTMNIFSESEWDKNKNIGNLFDMETFVPTGKEKKDAKKKIKIEEKNTKKLIRVETINKIINEKINSLINSVLAGDDEW